jgi:glucan phosphoethanolaminetransferase (alkaline phosphatase superfamily)
MTDSKATKDLIAIAIVCAAVFILSYFFNIFAFIVNFFKQYPQSIIYIDEILAALLTFSIGFAVFSWRRWQELKEEVKERIKLEDEIIRIANTNVEVERIINKQLRCEIELRRKSGINNLNLRKEGV